MAKRVDTATGEVTDAPAGKTFPTEWTVEVAEQLSRPIPEEQVGWLPKVPKSLQGREKRSCKLCGGWHEPISDQAHVPYLSHAVACERLDRVVGPHNWSYQVERVHTANGELRCVVGTMTVLGVTKGEEVGTPSAAPSYGEKLKGAYSDYLCRAAMRFGVGRELWAKQPLESQRTVVVDDDEAHSPGGAAGEREGRQGSAPQTATTPPPPPASRPEPGAAATTAADYDGNGWPTDDAITRLGSGNTARALVQGAAESFRAALSAVSAEHGGSKALWGSDNLPRWRGMLLAARSRLEASVGDADGGEAA